MTTLVWWAVIFTGHPSALAFAGSWLAVLLTTLPLWRVERPYFPLASWTRRSTLSLIGLLLLVPLLMARPYQQLGVHDADGGTRYRAYFTADFLWHAALTEELARQEPRPINPLLAAERLHYYWTYFRVPATIAAETGARVETVLKVNALLTALLLTASIYLAAWAARPDWPCATAAAVALTILAASLEGWAGLVDTIWRGLSLAELRNLNIDAIAAWAFKGLRIDNLPRTFWYTPQHGFSCALGLLAIPAALSPRGSSRWQGRLLVGVALAASVAFNPLLAAAFCVVYGIARLLDLGSTGALLEGVLEESIVAAPVLLALAWCWLNEVGDGAAGVLRFGLSDLARHATIPGLLLQLGPLLLAMACLLLPGPRAWRPIRPALVGLLVGLALMHFVALSVDPAWAGFRGGNLVFVFAPTVVAAGLIHLRERSSPRVALVFGSLVLVAGLPTTVIDLFNAQDVANRQWSRQAERVRGVDVVVDPAQEFHWTVVVTPEQHEALEWIRLHTAPDAVVQAEPIVRGRETWSLVPSLAARRTASTTPVPLLQLPVYQQRNHEVQEIYATADGTAAWQSARALHIDYLYVDAVERAAYPAGVAKFDRDTTHFASVFRNAGAVVYALRP